MYGKGWKPLPEDKSWLHSVFSRCQPLNQKDSSLQISPSILGKKIRNRGNLKRQARRCNISHLFQLSIQSIYARLQECKHCCWYFKCFGKKYRVKHLRNCLNKAKQDRDENTEWHILQIIHQEKTRAFWRKLNWALGAHRSTSVRTVQVKTDGGTVHELRTQWEVETAIWTNIHQCRYHLAEEAPIGNGPLRGKFGYNAQTLAQILFNYIIAGTVHTIRDISTPRINGKPVTPWPSHQQQYQEDGKTAW